MFRLKFPALLLTLLAAVSFNAIAATSSPSPTLNRILERGSLVVGMTGDMPPLNMTKKDGVIVGMEPDLAGYMADAMGVKLEISTMPFGDLLGALERGEIDMVMSGMTITPSRNLKFSYIGPYFVSGKCVLTKEETLAGAEEAGDLNTEGRKLTALKGSTSEKFVHALIPNAEYIPVAGYNDGVKMVLEDKIDAMIADYPICVVSLMRHPDAGLATVISVLSYEPIGVALPGGDALMSNWVENFIYRLQSTGDLKELKSTWFDNDGWVKDLP
jgi:polar amino acid transport system substrate-binding protein